MICVVGKIGCGLISMLALTPRQRLEALRSISQRKPSDDNGMLMLAIAVAAVLLIVGVGLLVRFWKSRTSSHTNWLFFHSRAEEMELNPDEVSMLVRMIKLIGMNRDPQAVLMLESVFRVGAEKYFEAEVAGRNSELDKREYGNRISLIRAKLGFGPSAIGEGQSSSRQIREDTHLTITARGRDGEFPAIVHQCNMECLIVKPDSAIWCGPGDKWLVRFFDHRALWEFETSVVRKRDDLVVLAHAENMRFINLQRFARVAVKQRTLIGIFPFHADNIRAVPPRFVEATIVEIAGPGLRIHMPQTLKKDSRILLVMEIEHKRIIQAIGTIRQVYAPEGIHKVYGVEMLGLSPVEVAELARITNQVSAKNKRLGIKAEWKSDIATSA